MGSSCTKGNKTSPGPPLIKLRKESTSEKDMFGRPRSKSVTSSVSTILGIDKSKVDVPLDEKDIMILNSTWQKVSNSIIDFGVTAFIKMFELNPNVKAIFEKFESDVSELMKAEVMKVHAMAVMSTIDDIISNVDDHNTVVELVLEQGHNHGHFGEYMTEDVLWALETPFLFAMKKFYGDKFAGQMKTTYEKTIHFILDGMCLGFRESRRQMNARAGNKLAVKQFEMDRKASLVSRITDLQSGRSGSIAI